MGDNCGMQMVESCEACPDSSFRLGYQPDSGDYYCVLARSEDGLVPGKAQVDGEKCWYSWGGEEKECEEFYWIRSHGHTVLARPNYSLDDGEVPFGALNLGQQEDGEYFVAIAHTDDGDVPGKARDGTCWYPFGGEEKNADVFSYVIARCGMLYDGARIQLGSQFGGNLRVNEDFEVDGFGEDWERATFIVLRNESDGTVRLQNEHWPTKFLAIRKDGLTTGSGGRYCVFQPICHKDGTVSFMSTNFPGRHVGLNEDRMPTDPKYTQADMSARFYISEKED